MSRTDFVTFLVAMIAITNPIGNTAIFIGMTGDKTRHEQKVTAIQCFTAIIIILLAVAWFGRPLLMLFGISIGAIECAGGLLLILIGLSMMKGQSTNNIPHNMLNKKALENKSHIAVVPLAIPIVAGPGSMATLIAHTEAVHNFSYLSLTSLICIICALIVGTCFYFSGFIAKVLGPLGIQIAAKVMGLVLISIAFQLLSNGLIYFFPRLV